VVQFFVFILKSRHHCNVRGPERSPECTSCPARRPPTSFGFNTIATRAAPFSGPLRLHSNPARTNLHRRLLRVASPGAQHSAEVLQLHLSPDHQGPPGGVPHGTWQRTRTRAPIASPLVTFLRAMMQLRSIVWPLDSSATPPMPVGHTEIDFRGILTATARAGARRLAGRLLPGSCSQDHH
jgi:hypothetical protein